MKGSRTVSSDAFMIRVPAKLKARSFGMAMSLLCTALWMGCAHPKTATNPKLETPIPHPPTAQGEYDKWHEFIEQEKAKTKGDVVELRRLDVMDMQVKGAYQRWWVAANYLSADALIINAKELKNAQKNLDATIVKMKTK